MTNNDAPYFESIKDRTIQASYGLWNALLTINGIMLAAATMLTNTQIS